MNRSVSNFGKAPKLEVLLGIARYLTVWSN